MEIFLPDFLNALCHYTQKYTLKWSGEVSTKQQQRRSVRSHLPVRSSHNALYHASYMSLPQQSGLADIHCVVLCYQSTLLYLENPRDRVHRNLQLPTSERNTRKSCETRMLISSALIPSLALSHILGIPGTTVTEHIGFT